MPKGIYERKPKDPIPRFMAKVDKQADGCWYWTSAIQPTGYGGFYFNGRRTLAHRTAYELFRGEIKDTIDHLCRVRHCVNPDHLEDVTKRENLLRGNTIVAKHAAKTHCDHGHEFTPENTRTRHYPSGRTSRRCQACNRRYFQKHVARQAAKLSQ